MRRYGRPFLLTMILSCVLFSSAAFAAMSYEAGLRFRPEHELKGAARVRLLATPTAETFKLPVGQLFNQGTTSLCWAYAMSHSLESRMLVTSNQTVAISRRYIQFDTLSVRLKAYADGTQDEILENNWPIDLVFIFQNAGALQFSDVPDVIQDADYSAITDQIDAASSIEDKEAAATSGMQALFGNFPESTTWNGVTMDRIAFQKTLLEGEAWTSYRPSTTQLGLAPDSDDDFPGAPHQVYWMTIAQIHQKIHDALASGVAPVYCTTEHCVLIYGAQYAADGTAQEYDVMDSISGFYQGDPTSMESGLADIVALPGPNG